MVFGPGARHTTKKSKRTKTNETNETNGKVERQQAKAATGRASRGHRRTDGRAVQRGAQSPKV